MKIEIDLNDILGDENGAETLQESVRRQVIANLTDKIQRGIGRQLDEQVSTIMSQELTKAVQVRMDDIVNDIMNAEYTPVERYGSKGLPTTFRKELVKAITAEATYSPKDSYSSSNENAFTRAIKAVVKAQADAFEKDFKAQIDDNFRKAALSFAVTELTKKLGVKV